MRAVIQRVLEAAVMVDGQEISRIGTGFMILLGVAEGDEVADGEWLSAKIAGMRIFDDLEGKMNLSLKDVGGEVLVISQFTLHAATRKGNRPSFIRAARPELAKPLYDDFCERIGLELGKPALRGVFGADMKVSLVNDGPVTVLMDSCSRE
jgi:D-aminoacyl-tRNA deacylase